MTISAHSENLQNIGTSISLVTLPSPPKLCMPCQGIKWVCCGSPFILLISNFSDDTPILIKNNEKNVLPIIKTHNTMLFKQFILGCRRGGHPSNAIPQRLPPPRSIRNTVTCYISEIVDGVSKEQY